MDRIELDVVLPRQGQELILERCPPMVSLLSFDIGPYRRLLRFADGKGCVSCPPGEVRAQFLLLVHPFRGASFDVPHELRDRDVRLETATSLPLFQISPVPGEELSLTRL
jgi:hypothetical protein